MAGQQAYIFTTSPSFNSDVSSPSGEKCPTMLHIVISELTAELCMTCWQRKPCEADCQF